MMHEKVEELIRSPYSRRGGERLHSHEVGSGYGNDLHGDISDKHE